MWLPFNARIWFYRTPVDFRKQIDGLVILVADTLEKDPTSGQLFVFRKRQEKSRFRFPGIVDDALEMTLQQLQWLLSGLDFTQHKQPVKLKVSNFY